MKVLRLMCCFLLPVLSTSLYAQQVPDQSPPLRLNVSLDSISSTVETTTSDYDSTVRQFSLAGTYQTAVGVYGQTGISYSNISSYTVNGNDSEPDDFTTWFIGAGFRFGGLSQLSSHWGLGLQRSDSGTEAVNTIKLFSEKDNRRRYGIVQISYSFNDSNDFYALKGKHFWFVSRSIGLGFSWGIGGGSIERTVDSFGITIFDDGDLIAGNLGVNFIYRPDI